MSYPISLEVNENSSSDLGDEDEEEAGEVLWGVKENVPIKIFTITTFKTLTKLKKINILLLHNLRK